MTTPFPATERNRWQHKPSEQSNLWYISLTLWVLNWIIVYLFLSRSEFNLPALVSHPVRLLGEPNHVINLDLLAVLFPTANGANTITYLWLGESTGVVTCTLSRLLASYDTAIVLIWRDVYDALYVYKPNLYLLSDVRALFCSNESRTHSRTGKHELKIYLI